MSGRHPHFDDRRATAWHTTLADGIAAAREAGRALFVQIGRQSCGGSRALVERTLPKDEIAEFLNASFVAVALDADALDPDGAALLARATKKEPTPVCLYLAADGRLLHATAGGRPAAVFLQDLTEALAKR
jgi:hypothetical protein